MKSSGKIRSLYYKNNERIDDFIDSMRFALGAKKTKQKLDIGIFDDTGKKYHPESLLKRGRKKTIIEVAIQNEFGTRKIPPRPFIRPAKEMLAIKARESIDFLKRKYKNSLYKHDFIYLVLQNIGVEITNIIKENLSKGIPPEITLKRMDERANLIMSGFAPVGSSVETPLFFTKTLYNSISFRIDGKSPDKHQEQTRRVAFK